MGTGGHGFDPGPWHTKVVKNGTSCSSLGTQTYGVELGLVDTSVRIMFLGHDNSVRQLYKSEHWAPCRNQTLSWYDWKVVESEVKPEQTTTTTFWSWFRYRMYNKNELPHDKTNKKACAHSEDSDQSGHPPSLIRVFAVHMKKAWVLSYPLSAQQRLWSDWADAQADLSLRWVHMPYCWFCHEAAY